jgi:hypothetical protein
MRSGRDGGFACHYAALRENENRRARLFAEEGAPIRVDSPGGIIAQRTRSASATNPP